MTGWHTRPLATFDTESTGVDVFEDRVVTAAVAHLNDGPPRKRDWLVNPGIPIAPEATAVHGVTDFQAGAFGRPPAEALDEVAAELAAALGRGIPVVIMNATFDTTLLDADCRRHGVQTVTDRLGGAPWAPIIDPRVLDKNLDRYRKGTRKLTDLAKHYRVTLDGAHDATADALGAARVAWRIACMYQHIAEMDPMELHERQVEWAAEQTASFAAYRRALGNPIDDEDGSWPIRRRNTTTQQESEAA